MSALRLPTNDLLAYHSNPKGLSRNQSMKRTTLRFNFFAASMAAALCATTAQSLAPIQSHSLPGAAANHARTATAFVQYDDPYSEFRNARYSNAEYGSSYWTNAVA